jgi:hypothetical protein
MGRRKKVQQVTAPAAGNDDLDSFIAERTEESPGFPELVKSVLVVSAELPATEVPIPRKRGRPRKIIAAPEATPIESIEPPKKQLGRPKKVILIDGPLVAVTPPDPVLEPELTPSDIKWGVDVCTVSVYPILKSLGKYKASPEYLLVETINNMATWGEPRPCQTSRRIDNLHKDLLFADREKALEALDQLVTASLKLLSKKGHT